MVITSYFLSRHLHRPCVIHDLSTIHVPQLCLNMVIVVVNHVLKHVTRRNHIVITSTGTLNNNTPLSTSIINKFLSAWSCSPNTGISPSPLIPLFHLELFQQSLKDHIIGSLWSENYTQLKLKKQPPSLNIHLGRIHWILPGNCTPCLSNWEKIVTKSIWTLYYKLRTIQKQVEGISGNKDCLLKQNVVQSRENGEISKFPRYALITCDLNFDKCTLCT